MRVADLLRDADLLPAVQASAETLIAENPESVRALTRRWVGAGERYGRIG
jgi:ATP-dependent DNA helicase RecG